MVLNKINKGGNAIDIINILNELINVSCKLLT